MKKEKVQVEHWTKECKQTQMADGWNFVETLKLTPGSEWVGTEIGDFAWNAEVLSQKILTRIKFYILLGIWLKHITLVANLNIFAKNLHMIQISNSKLSEFSMLEQFLSEGPAVYIHILHFFIVVVLFQSFLTKESWPRYYWKEKRKGALQENWICVLVIGNPI
jgi:hypothetical protein